MTYLWSHGVDVKGQSGVEPADPTATPMFFHATPGLRTAGLGHGLWMTVGETRSEDRWKRGGERVSAHAAEMQGCCGEDRVLRDG